MFMAPPIEKLLKEAVYDEHWVDGYYDVVYGASCTPLPRLAGDDSYPKIALKGISDRPPPPAKVDTKKFGSIKVSATTSHIPYGKPRPDHMTPESKEPRTQTKNIKFADLPVDMKDLTDQFSGKVNWFSPHGNVAEEKVDPNAIINKDKNVEVNKNFKAPLKPPDNGKALVQFIDVDVEPGAVYQYQIQVRMANPNFDQPDNLLAYPDLAKVKELTSTSPMWVETPPIAIPTDFQYYITNQDKNFVSKWVKGSKEPHPIDQDNSTFSVQAIGNKKVPFQIHRFIDTVEQARGGSTSTYPIADWAIAERLLVARGEPVGRKCELEAVTWNKFRTKWEVPGIGDKGIMPSKKEPPLKVIGVAVDFRMEPPIVLLDFTGGRQVYAPPAGSNAKASFDDDRVIEALLLMPDMSMTLHNGREDCNNSQRDQERRQRYEIWKGRLEELLYPTPPVAPKLPGKGPF
jgi:hypothetical protein